MALGGIVTHTATSVFRGIVLAFKGILNNPDALPLYILPVISLLIAYMPLHANHFLISFVL